MKYTVVLDPGHGGRDPGAVAHGLKEKDLNLMLAKKVADRLGGIRVILTRESDFYVSLKDRVALSNRAGADLFVSLHANAGGGHGFESFVYQGLGKGDPAVQYRKVVHKSVMNILSRWDIRDRGRKTSAFYVLRYNRVPAMLLESLFIDNEREAALWREPPFVEALADGVAAGIRKALGFRGDEAESETGNDNLKQDNQSPVNAREPNLKDGPDYLYTVQVGAFALRDNARSCLERARDAGFGDAFIYKKKIS